MHVHLYYVHIYAHIYVYIHTYCYVCKSIWINICIYIYTYICGYIHNVHDYLFGYACETVCIFHVYIQVPAIYVIINLSLSIYIYMKAHPRVPPPKERPLGVPHPADVRGKRSPSDDA